MISRERGRSRFHRGRMRPPGERPLSPIGHPTPLIAPNRCAPSPGGGFRPWLTPSGLGRSGCCRLLPRRPLSGPQRPLRCFTRPSGQPRTVVASQRPLPGRCACPSKLRAVRAAGRISPAASAGRRSESRRAGNLGASPAISLYPSARFRASCSRRMGGRGARMAARHAPGGRVCPDHRSHAPHRR